MADREQEQKPEELLDSMLAAYSAVEPRPGLETRILANLRAQGGQNERSWSRLWLWAGAGAAAVIAALVLVVLNRPMERSSTTPAEIVKSRPQATPDTPSPENPKHEPGTGVTASRRKATAEQIADARPDVFPTPSPLSEQEKLLLRYLAGTPREEIVAQSHPDEPPQDALPENQTALPGAAVNNSQLTNAR